MIYSKCYIELVKMPIAHVGRVDGSDVLFGVVQRLSSRPCVL